MIDKYYFIFTLYNNNNIIMTNPILHSCYELSSGFLYTALTCLAAWSFYIRSYLGFYEKSNVTIAEYWRFSAIVLYNFKRNSAGHHPVNLFVYAMPDNSLFPSQGGCQYFIHFFSFVTTEFRNKSLNHLVLSWIALQCMFLIPTNYYRNWTALSSYAFICCCCCCCYFL